MQGGPYHDVKVAAAVQGQVTDGAGVEVAAAVFQLVDQLHCPQFRRAGDRTAWKSGVQQIHDGQPGAQCPDHV